MFPGFAVGTRENTGRGTLFLRLFGGADGIWRQGFAPYRFQDIGDEPDVPLG